MGSSIGSTVLFQSGVYNLLLWPLPSSVFQARVYPRFSGYGFLPVFHAVVLM